MTKQIIFLSVVLPVATPLGLEPPLCPASWPKFISSPDFIGELQRQGLGRTKGISGVAPCLGIRVLGFGEAPEHGMVDLWERSDPLTIYAQKCF